MNDAKACNFSPFHCFTLNQVSKSKGFPVGAKHLYQKERNLTILFRNSNEQLCHIKAMLKDFYSNGNSAALYNDPTELELPAK